MILDIVIAFFAGLITGGGFMWLKYPPKMGL